MPASTHPVRLGTAEPVLLSDAEFGFLQSLLLRRSGTTLWNEKRYFANARVSMLAHQHGFVSASELVARVRKEPDGDLATRLVEGMTVNETYFYRDQRPFEQVESAVLPHLAATKPAGQPLRIWCAACAAGQEAYSLAMILGRQGRVLGGRAVEIVASDLSREMVAKARSGRYSHFEVQRGLPINDLLQHFRQTGDAWEIVPELRQAVDFRVHNLMDEPSSLGSFDLVLLRNVLIYFDLAVKAEVLGRVARTLSPHGLLILGAAESILGLGQAVEPHPRFRGIYRRAQPGSPPS